MVPSGNSTSPLLSVRYEFDAVSQGSLNHLYFIFSQNALREDRSLKVEHMSCVIESDAGFLMRPEHSETKAKTETREWETEIETETENLL